MNKINEEPKIFLTGDRISHMYILLWRHGFWSPGEESQLINGDIWIPIPDQTPSEELLQQSKDLQTRPCPKCAGTMRYEKVRHEVTWKQNSKTIEVPGWYCHGTNKLENPESEEELIECNCGHVLIDEKFLGTIECERVTLIDFNLFTDVSSLAQFFHDHPGHWKALTDTIRRIVGWENQTSDQYVGMTLTEVRKLDLEWFPHFRTPEDRSRFPNWCLEERKA